MKNWKNFLFGNVKNIKEKKKCFRDVLTSFEYESKLLFEFNLFEYEQNVGTALCLYRLGVHILYV